SDPDYYGKGLGIAVRKGNDALLQEINAALDKVKASPEYAQMHGGEMAPGRAPLAVWSPACVDGDAGITLDAISATFANRFGALS
ncbi:transporter substrate-binding domain-containing protein, partial [Salmonella enterica subsp. enterica serovar Montevideo]|nr:transporter substrate-binding domain-containing protein [Salmonella enterica subsp. enterica serovar Montevideo]